MRRTTLLLLTLSSALACRSTVRHDSSPTAEILPETPYKQAEKDAAACIAKGQAYDDSTKACRMPTDRECIARNQRKTTTAGCREALRPTHSEVDWIDFRKYCKPNESGAWVDCHDAEISLPIPPIPASPYAPEWLAESEVAVELSFKFMVTAAGKVIIRVQGADGEGEALDLHKTEQSFVLRKLPPQKPLTVQLHFSADAILLSQSFVPMPTLAVRLQDLARLEKDAREQNLHGRWIAAESLRLRDRNMPGQNVFNEWVDFVKTSLPATAIWNLKRDCPAAQLQESMASLSCQENFVIPDREEWRGKPFLNLCDSFKPIQVDTSQGTTPLQKLAVFPTDPFRVSIDANTRFLSNCSILVFDLKE